VSPVGVVLGRDPACDVVLRDPGASRFHALVRPTARGPTVTALGRGEVRVSGQPTLRALLAHGDRIEVPGSTLTVEIEGPSPLPIWQVVVSGGPPVRVGHAGFLLGAGGDLDLAGWPAGALRFEPGPTRLGVTGSLPWARNGVPVPAELTVGVLPGDVLTGSGPEQIVVERGAEAATTVTHSERYDRVELEFMARGGRLRAVCGPLERAVWIPERRFALLVALLEPAAPLQPGDHIPDEVLLPQIWPRQPHKSRVDLNVLVKRLRRDLEAGGLPPSTIARAEGGGATCFRLAPGATVRVS
jgi:hypothetical protein